MRSAGTQARLLAEKLLRPGSDPQLGPHCRSRRSRMLINSSLLACRAVLGQVLGGHMAIEGRGRHGSIREHRNDISRDLDKPAVDVISPPAPVPPPTATRRSRDGRSWDCDPGAIPISPSYSGSATKSTDSSRTVASGVHHESALSNWGQ